MKRAQREKRISVRIDRTGASGSRKGRRIGRGVVVMAFCLLLAVVLPWTASAAEKKQAQGPVSITGVQFLTDTGDEAILMISGSPADGGLRSSEEVVSTEGREWLRIRMRPAVLKEEKRLRLESEIIGEVRLENDPVEADTVVVSLELLPPLLTYSVSGVKNSSSVMVTVSTLEQGKGQKKK